MNRTKEAATEFYPINSSFAYNFWQLLGIARRCDVPVCRDKGTGVVTDGTDFLGLTTRHWGLVLFAISAATVIVVLRKARGAGFLALGTSLCILAFFVFMTRMHERYLFPFFLPFLAACVLLRSRMLWTVFGALAVVHLLNSGSCTRSRKGPPSRSGGSTTSYPELWVTGLSTGRAFALVVVGGFLAALWTAYRLAPRR